MKILIMDISLKLYLLGFLIQLIFCENVQPIGLLEDYYDSHKEERDDQSYFLPSSEQESDFEHRIENINIESLTSLKSNEEKLRLAFLERDILYGVAPNWNKFYNDQQNSEYQPGSSSPGCPEPFEGKPWVFHSKTEKDAPRCYLVNYQGPCPPEMTLFANSSSQFGYCDCSCQLKEPKGFCRIGGSIFNFHEEKILAYVKKWDSCHVLFEQGPCPQDYWLVFGKNPAFGPLCEPRRCPSSKDERLLSYYDFKSNECHIVENQCIHPDAHTRYTNHGLQFGSYFVHESDSWFPSCSFRQTLRNGAGSHGSSINSNPCRDGEHFSRIFRQCVLNLSYNQYSQYSIG